MPKSIAKVVTGGRGYELRPPEAPSLFAELAGDPACHDIATAALQAARLGFDMTDPEVRATVIAAGRREHARKGGADTTPPQLDQPAPRDHHRRVVYYMRLGDLVKIGTSVNIRARYESIHPQGIDAVEFGDRALETARHRQFVDDHQHAEWFRRSPQLAAHITERAAAFHAESGQTVAAWLRERIPALAS